MVMTRSETSKASRQAATERPPSTRSENEAVLISTTSGAQRNAPPPSALPPRTAIATDAAYRPERIRESTEHAYRTMGVTGAPLPRASSSHAIAPHRDVTSVAAAASTLGATQDLPLRGSSSQPTQDRTLPSTSYAQYSPTQHNSGVRYHHVTSPSTPTTTIDAATDNAAAPPASADFMPHRAAPLLTTSGRTTTKKSSRQSERLLRIARAKEEYVRLQAQLAAAHIETLEAEAQAEDEEDARTTLSEQDDAAKSQRIDTWLSEQQIVSMRDDNHRQLTAPPPRSMPATAAQLQPAPAAVPTAEAYNNMPTVAPRDPIAELAAAITLSNSQVRTSLPPRCFELPVYDGSYKEWLVFKAAYDETATYYTDAENTARLRRNLKGQAKEAVANLLLHPTAPAEIMKTLQVRFGRPRAIAKAEVKRLRDLPRLRNNPEEICVFANKVANVVAALKALGCEAYLIQPDLTAEIAGKLTPTLHHEWIKYTAEQPDEEPDLLKLSSFLQVEADIYSPHADPEPDIPDTNNRGRRNNNQKTYSVQIKARSCRACQKTDHSLNECNDFQSLMVDDRWDVVKKNHLCFRCLRHRTKEHRCKFQKCGIDGCQYPHHQLLHNNRLPPTPKTETVSSTWTTSAAAYLKMAPVTLSGPAGDVDTWALLDDGSTVSLIEEQLAERVGAQGPIIPLYISAIGNKKIDASKSRSVHVTLRGREGEPQQLKLRTVHGLRLTPQRVRKEDIVTCEHLEDLWQRVQTNLAQPKILIGQDNWHLLVTEEMKTGRRDQLVASLTPLGWVVHGAHAGTKRQQVHFVAHLSNVENVDDRLDETLRLHFAMESLTVAAKTPVSDPEHRALKILREKTKQQPDGRYETALLWRNNDEMPDNRDAALRRLISVERKMKKEPMLATRYREKMAAFITKGYAEPAPPSKTPGRTWYLPHFAVVNAMKPDKLRIVHDAAAKTRGRSLNDYLLTGPDLLQSLPGVLLRFRQHAVAVSADIKEMFMQVKIRLEDRDALRYLWREHPEDQPAEFRMTSLIFGATSSPATAIFIKNLNAEKFCAQYPEASSAIVRSHYMDDYLGSYKTEAEAIKIASEVRNIHAAGGFELAKWTTNSTTVLRELTQEDVSPEVTITGAPAYERILGLVWKPDSDILAFNLDLARISPEVLQREKPTKREALKIVMSLYDPLGYASVITIQAKKLLQELWRRGTPWDMPVDDDVAMQWREWMEHLLRLRDIAIPRCHLGYSTAAKLQLHTFVDASESAYAAALYWRIIEPNGNIQTSLVLAKARVAPVKLMSIPRLELQAAVMGSRMAAAVTEEHDRKPDARYFWTDSATVLTWLRTGARSYRPFVAHRIAAIEENSALAEWRWVPTKLNVADDATRNVPLDFGNTHRWFTGPKFLQDNESAWPTPRIPVTVESTSEERCTALTADTTALREVLPDPERFSKWERFLRASARVIQFIDRCKQTSERTHYKRTRTNKSADPTWTKYKTGETRAIRAPQPDTSTSRFVVLEADTLRRAEDLIWRFSQEEAFTNDVNAIRQGKSTTTGRLAKLAVIWNDGLLRLRSRIDRLTGSEAMTSSPLILDGNRHEIRLHIDYLHRRLHHAGAEATIAECRQTYWILRLRPVTKTVIHRCLPCRIRKDMPPRPATGDHPVSRLAHHQRPFTYVGVDYFGPYPVTCGRATKKYYVAIFTCLTTRGIHLEAAESLSTDSAIMALRRMIARRGTPTEIWSDNGTNLRGADKKLRQALDKATTEEATKHLISWRFIPPSAPFMGGSWERMVRSVKAALAATQHPRHPTLEVFQTLLVEAEFTVNSRPITYVSVSADDPAPLTPNHFILGGPARLPTAGTFKDTDLIGRTHWRASQRLADIFWSRWLREYLPELQHRREPHSRGLTVQLGDVVIIADNTLPRNTWPRGIVQATYPGADNITRVVDVRTAGGVLRRPVKKLIILPTSPAAHEKECSALDDTARRENVPDDRQN